MADDRSWMEQIFGDSWETSLAGWGGSLLGILLVVLGRILNVQDLVVAGVSLIGLSVAAVGQLSRSKRASAAAKVERVALHNDNVREIQAVKGQVADVKDEMREETVHVAKAEAREVAAEVAERTVEAHKR